MSDRETTARDVAADSNFVSKEATTALVPTSFAQVQEMGGYFAKSMLLPPALRGKEADVAMTIATGLELGISPMSALRSIYVVEGRPFMSADLMQALVIRSGLCAKFEVVEYSEAKVAYEGQRKGGRVQIVTWTIEMATKAGLAGEHSKKDTWKKYPARMLSNRAKADLCKLLWPDVILGCALEDDLEDVRDIGSGATERWQAPPDAIDADIVSETEAAAAPEPEPAPPATKPRAAKPTPAKPAAGASGEAGRKLAEDLVVDIESAETQAELNQLPSRFAGVDNALLVELVKPAFTKRAAELKEAAKAAKQ